MVEAGFEAYFRPWALSLPFEAVEARADGTLYARGWAVRWRWLPEDALEFHASHRMTSDRWQILFPDGRTEHRPTAPEMSADDEPGARQRYRQAWGEYRVARAERDMHPRPLDDAPKKWDAENQLLWCLDNASPWKIVTLPPRQEI